LRGGRVNSVPCEYFKFSVQSSLFLHQ
jgi:hypothetical protein